MIKAQSCTDGQIAHGGEVILPVNCLSPSRYTIEKAERVVRCERYGLVTDTCLFRRIWIRNGKSKSLPDRDPRGFNSCFNDVTMSDVGQTRNHSLTRLVPILIGGERWIEETRNKTGAKEIPKVSAIG